MKTPLSTSQLQITNYCLIFLIFALLLTACATPPLVSPTSLLPAATKTAFILPPTWTLAPPTETPIPISPTSRPTHTPTQTNTPAPTFPPSPTAFPPVNVATTDDHPFPFYSLLFLQTGVVREWNTRGEIVDLVTVSGTTNRLDRVQLFDTSAGGALVAILRRNASGQTEIVLYDRAAGAIRWTQTIEANSVTDLEISPDNLWVAYAGSGSESQPGEIGVMLTEAPDRTTSLSQCEFSCGGILWTPASTRLIWSDETGLWQVDPALGAGQTPEQLLEPPLQILNSGAQNITGTYTLGSFSPSGRYILLSKGSIPEGLPSVFDTQTKRVADLSGSFLYTDPGSSVTWLSDDTLAVARAGLAAGEQPTIETWQLAAETETLLVQSGTTRVGNSPSQAPFVITQLADGGVRFAMLDFSTPQYSPGNGIYFLDLADDDLLQLNALPFLRIQSALWTPDGSGVLLLTAQKSYYVPANGATIYDIDAFLGAGASSFTWIP